MARGEQHRPEWTVVAALPAAVRTWRAKVHPACCVGVQPAADVTPHMHRHHAMASAGLATLPLRWTRLLAVLTGRARRPWIRNDVLRWTIRGWTVPPGLLQVEAHAPRIDDLHLAHPILEQLGGGAAVTVE